jgi:hypothetical protein
LEKFGTSDSVLTLRGLQPRLAPKNGANLGHPPSFRITVASVVARFVAIILFIILIIVVRRFLVIFFVIVIGDSSK